jgi:pilus assembly protein CpaB
MGRRTVLLVVAVLIAALGTTLVFVYANNANDRALADQKPVQVLFAKTSIAPGVSAADAQKAGAFELRTIAANSEAPGALSDITPIADKLALSEIFPGEQIIAAKFGDRGSVSALPIPGDKVAISVQLGDPARVAGFVQPGSNVAVFVTMGSGQQTNTQPAQNFTRVLLPKAEVIAVGPSTFTTTTSSDTSSGQTNTEQVPKAILTLALDQVDTQKLIYASQNGQLYFALLTADSKVAPGGPTTADNLFN